jgi:hypothetical protein
VNAVFLAAAAVTLLALWALLDSVGDGLSDTWDVVLTVAALVCALIAAFLSLPRAPRRP